MMHDGWMVGMWWFWLLVLVLVVALVWLVARSVSSGRRSAREPNGAQVSRNPEQILEERFARGEIDDQEFRRRRMALREED